MKKKVFLMLIGAAVLTLGGCFSKPTALQQGLLYSNLTDGDSTHELNIALQTVHIAEQTIDEFLANVDYFNNTIEYTSLNDGFTLTGTLNPAYDQGKILELWEKKSPHFIGYNCRLTAFHLMKEKIKINTPQSGDASQLFLDEDAIESSPIPLFTDQQKSDFKTFFSAVPTELTKDIAVHIQKIQNFIKANGITYPQISATTPSLISVWMHTYFSEEENYLFVGHIGVLLPREDGTFYFIEKLAFQEPYQFIKFPTRQHVSDYLMNKYDIEQNQPTSRPIIMENDQLISGYRSNPNNP